MLQSSSSENNLVNCFGSNFHKKGVLIMGCTQNENNFFGRNNKNRSSAFGNFLFYHNNICFGWVMNLFLSWVIFFVKKVSFPAKTADGQHHQCSSELHWFKTPASIPFRFSSYHSHYHLQWQKENVQPVEWNFKLNNQAWTFAIFNTEHKNKVLLTNWYKQLYKYVYVNLQFEEAKLLDFNVTI